MKQKKYSKIHLQCSQSPETVQRHPVEMILAILASQPQAKSNTSQVNMPICLRMRNSIICIPLKSPLSAGLPS